MLRVGLTGGIATGKTTVVAMLRELGCDLAQGYWISRPLPPDGLSRWTAICEWVTGRSGPPRRADHLRVV